MIYVYNKDGQWHWKKVSKLRYYILLSGQDREISEIFSYFISRFGEVLPDNNKIISRAFTSYMGMLRSEIFDEDIFEEALSVWANNGGEWSV